MIRLVIESAYKASERFSVQQNITFAQRVCRHAVLLGYAPYASHLFYTQRGILDDNIQSERMLGINAGLAWAEAAEVVWFCLRPDEDFTEGMKIALRRHTSEERRICLALFEEDGTFVEFKTDQLAFDEVLG